MSDSDRLVRMERRQEMLIQAVTSLADTMGIAVAMLEEVAEWLKKPPSNDLPDALKQLATQVLEARREIGELPVKVARAVIDGEV